MAFIKIEKAERGGGRESKNPNEVAMYMNSVKQGASKAFTVCIGRNIGVNARIRAGDHLDFLVDAEERKIRLQVSTSGWAVQRSGHDKTDLGLSPSTLFIHPRPSEELMESLRRIRLPAKANPIFAHNGIIEAVFPA
jgi:hypothetical protein